jgi:large subunit ribosomal protein L31
MKKDIHPQVNTDTKVTCVCGNTFTTMSTLPEIKIDICSACHPFYTGTAKFVDTEGRIDKFNRKLKKIQEKKDKSSKKSKKTTKTETADQ